MSVAVLTTYEGIPEPRITTTLKDGRRVVIRRLHPDDAPALVRAIENANPIDMRRRFMGTPPPTSFLVRRLAVADGIHDYALGAFDADDRLVAVAQFDRIDDEPSADLGIEVARDWQRCGLGRRMLVELADVARRLGICRFTATYYADNIPVRRLLHSSDLLIASGVNQGEGYAVLDLCRP